MFKCTKFCVCALVGVLIKCLQNTWCNDKDISDVVLHFVMSLK